MHKKNLYPNAADFQLKKKEKRKKDKEEKEERDPRLAVVSAAPTAGEFVDFSHGSGNF